MNVCVVTGYDNAMRDIGALTSARLLRYCSVNGYDCVVHRDKSFDTSRAASWSKIRFIQAAIRSGLYDWVLWIDADALVLRDDVTIETVPCDGERLLLAQDGNGVNAGVLLLRADDAMLAFLAHWYAQTQFLSHQWWEQAALMHLLGIDGTFDRPDVGFLAKKVWNAYPSDVDENSFILHVAAMQKDRFRILQKHLYASTIARP